jgi:hypothetical protein
MKNKEGFIGLIAILIVVAIAAIWMASSLRHSWYSSPNLNVSDSAIKNTEDKSNQDSKGASPQAQVEALRQDMKKIQDDKNKELNAALGK